MRRDSFADARAWCARQIAALPSDLRRVDADASFDVQPSEELRAEIERPLVRS